MWQVIKVRGGYAVANDIGEGRRRVLSRHMSYQSALEEAEALQAKNAWRKEALAAAGIGAALLVGLLAVNEAARWLAG